MLIRAATLPDLEAVWGIEHRVFGAELYPRFFFRQALDLWGELLRVAECPSGVLAGYILGAVSRRREEAWILSAAVSPEHRGRGIATELTRDLLQVLTGAGAREVRLTVHPANRKAVGLYRKLGFRSLAEDAEYFGPGEPRILMRARLGSLKEST